MAQDKVPSRQTHLTPGEFEAIVAKLKAEMASRPTSPDTFDEAERRRQNQEWLERDRAKRQWKLRVHDAIHCLKGQPLEQQRQWLACNPDRKLVIAVFRYLVPSLQIELINSAEDEVHRQASEIEERERQNKPPRATDFLRSLLSGGNRVLAKTVLQRAAAARVSKRTLYQAKAKLRVRSERVGFGPDGHFVWVLPDQVR